MSNTKQKPEMTVEEFIKVYLSYRMDKPQIEADLRSVIRGKLKEFCHQYIPDRNEIAFVDEFMNENWIE